MVIYREPPKFKLRQEKNYEDYVYNMRAGSGELLRLLNQEHPAIINHLTRSKQ